MKKIAIIDYGFGNIKSVTNALLFCGADPVVISSPKELSNYGGAVLPGVGAFAPAIQFLKNLNFDKALLDYLSAGKMLYGSCLGFQLLFTRSFENGENVGLNIIEGDVKHFNFTDGKLKIPHMGWNNVELKNGNNIKKMFDGINDSEQFYFVHSYYVALKNPSQIGAITKYGVSFCSAVAIDNVWGSQFHPEKSGNCGLKLMKNFIGAC
ncbi:MAG: imidazole glycerol phosphate synthase subunit HisH [Elusimicrobiota bacterium]|jgi:glutamine amidotransferase|nr:imidazole glycerol phosphate synthase subunit HisH [Elusimicrobiota bacterium]